MFSSVTNGDEFAKAYTKIENVNTHHQLLNKSFCKQIVEGGAQKLACLIKDLPDIGFFVSKRLELELGVPCLEVTENEVRNLDT